MTMAAGWACEKPSGSRCAFLQLSLQPNFGALLQKKMIACNPEQVETVTKSGGGYQLCNDDIGDSGGDDRSAIGNPCHKICLGCNRES